MQSWTMNETLLQYYKKIGEISKGLGARWFIKTTWSKKSRETVPLSLSCTALGPIWHSKSITHECGKEPGIRDKLRPERSSFTIPVMFPNQEGVQSRQSCVIIHSLISGSEMIDWSLIYLMYQSIPLCTLQFPVDL